MVHILQIRMTYFNKCVISKMFKFLIKINFGAGEIVLDVKVFDPLQEHWSIIKTFSIFRYSEKITRSVRLAFFKYSL